MPKGEGKVVAQNKKAAMIILLKKHLKQELSQGTEIKSIREGRVNLKDSFATSSKW